MTDDHLADLHWRASVRECSRDGLQPFQSEGGALRRQPRGTFVGVQSRIVDRDRGVASELRHEREVIGVVVTPRLRHRERDRAECSAARDQRRADRRPQPDAQEDQLLLLRETGSLDQLGRDVGEEGGRAGAEHLRQPVRRSPITIDLRAQLPRPRQLRGVAARHGDAPQGGGPIAGRLRVHDVDRTPVREGRHGRVGYLLQDALVVQ